MRMKIAITIARGAALCALLAGGGQLAAQQVYKCVTPSGGLRYADAPCAPAESARTIVLVANTLDTAVARESALQQENERLREQLRSAQAGAVPADPAAVTATSTVAAPADADAVLAQRIDSVACQRAKRDYEVTASSTANTKAIIEAKRSMMYGACGMREPDVTRNLVKQTVVVGRPTPWLRPGTALAVLP